MARPLYKAYNFRGKSPNIDKLRTVVEDHFGHRVTRKDLKVMEEGGGPTIGCMAGWFFGDTERPQDTTLEAAGHSIGYEREWVRIGRNKRKR